ncbi:hypothetical protein [Erythrobacter sp. R86502]|uniref:hypothetical protein n=1 Tax=Erythrobacter sp. R86502 TaxID=3093846 RepID=UPI0036D3A08A
MQLQLVMIASFVVAFLLTYFVSRKLIRATARIGALFACLIAPVIIYTAWFALMPDDGEGFWAWWMTGLVMLSPGLAAWIVGSLSGGFLAAKASSISPWQ